MTRKPANPKTLAGTVASYPKLLADLKQRIRAAQVRTVMAGNASMLMLYWEIGGMLAGCARARISECRVIDGLGGLTKRRLGRSGVKVR